MEEDEGEPETMTKKATGMSQDQWNQLTGKERKYFLLTVTWEAACVYDDKGQMSDLAKQMSMLAEEINMEAMARVSSASSSHQEVQRQPDHSQNTEECQEKHASS